MRGPGFHGTGKGGTKVFDWSTWNWPLPGRTTRGKETQGYTTESGIHKYLLVSFLEMMHNGNSCESLHEDQYLKLFPVSLQRDGMQIKPGLVVDSRQGICVGSTERIDSQFINKHPNPTPEFLKQILVKEADCCCVTTLDGKLSLPIGIDYLPPGLTGEDTKISFMSKIQLIQTCLRCLKSGRISSKSGVLVTNDPKVCNSRCEECLNNNEICSACTKNHHASVHPSMRRCNACVQLETQCIKCVVLIVTNDSESKNKSAAESFEKSKKEGNLERELQFASCLPDGVHVAKRMARHFSNWYLLVDGYRVNRVLLRTLRCEPSLRDLLRKHLTVAACRNRDRIDTESIVEISCEDVRNILSDKVDFITETIILEKYRVYDGNKMGVLSSPTAICTGPNSVLFIGDTTKGAVMSARLHYPVDVSELCTGLKQPVALLYNEGILYIADIGRGELLCMDLDGSTLYNPGKMTIKQLQTTLKKERLWQQGDNKAQKSELQKRLQDWVRRNSDENNQSSVTSQGVHKVCLSRNMQSPSALALDGHGCVLVADMKTETINVCDVSSNGTCIKLTVKQSISSVSPVYGLAVKDKSMYIASCNIDNGGIFSCNLDSTGWSDTVRPVLNNNTHTCNQVHALAKHPDGIVFTDTGSHQVKLLTSGDEVHILAGTGAVGHSDGSRGQFCQPTSVCTELKTVYVTDSAVGRVAMVTSSNALLAFLENLDRFASVLGLHKKSKKPKEHSMQEAVTMLSTVKDFLLDCHEKVKVHSGKTRPQGPEGACSQQNLSDISMIINGLCHVRELLLEMSPALEAKFHMMSALTLVVEHMFANMREGNDMPLVLQFAHKFSSCTRELLKQMCQCSFLYFTSDKSYYQRAKVNTSYKDLPRMPLPPRVSLSTTQMDSLRQWRAEFGQSVRQVTVRNQSTKDKPGTLPMNVYTSQLPKPKLVNFTEVTNQDNRQSEERTDREERNIAFHSGSFVYPKRSCTPLTLFKLTEDIFGESTQPCQAFKYVNDIIEATSFNKDGVCSIEKNDIEACLDVSLVEEIQDTLYIGEDLLAELLYTCKDQGDTISMDEEQEAADMVTETYNVTTRSGRISKRKRDLDFVTYN